MQDRRKRPAVGAYPRRSVRTWAVWTLPLAVRALIFVVVAAYGAALVIAGSTASWSAQDAMLFAVLTACGAISVEATRRLGEPAGVGTPDLLSTWTLPAALLLDPIYALVVPVPLTLLTQLRVRHSPLHRRVYSAAAMGLSYATASIVFHALEPAWRTGPLDSGRSAILWVGAACLAAVLNAVINAVLVAAAVRGSVPESRWRSLLFDVENLRLELLELSCGVIIAILCALSPLLVVLALPPVLLLQRSMLFAQLQAAARTDPKTTLLNAAAWEREASSEIARAQQAGVPAAVLLLDLDHFKRINDTFGHLVGDGVLRAVAEVLRGQIREHDIVGRFGGEEFAILLPGADQQEASRVAERLRMKVAELGVPVGDGSNAQVTASIGISVLQQPGTGVTELFAEADHALYRAKAAGRNQTWTEAARVPGDG